MRGGISVGFAGGMRDCYLCAFVDDLMLHLRISVFGVAPNW